jgi:hypothetical protein
MHDQSVSWEEYRSEPKNGGQVLGVNRKVVRGMFLENTEKWERDASFQNWQAKHMPDNNLFCSHNKTKFFINFSQKWVWEGPNDNKCPNVPFRFIRTRVY